MNICVIGVGYVGLVCGTCFAEMGNNVICVDINETKIKKIKDGIISIYEPGLEEMVRKNIAANRLSFNTQLKEGIKDSKVIFIVVNTPPDEEGNADLKHVIDVAKQIGQTIIESKIIVNKSTVPVGTAKLVKETIQAELNARSLDDLSIDVISNPEFLKEGTAVHDFMHPDRIVVGANNPNSIDCMKELYAPFIRNGHLFLCMDITSAELTKYAANAMLATRISFMNEMALLCEKIGADIENIRKGIGTDPRIGMSFLYAGLGYGGSCFPKDVKALQRTIKQNYINNNMLSAIQTINDNQICFFIDKIVQYFSNDLTNKKITIWGLSFKPNTDDVRESPSLKLIDSLIAKGATINCYDPESMQNVSQNYKDKPIYFAKDMYDAINKSNAIVLATEWGEFRNPDFEKMKKLLLNPVIFDGRNQYEPQKMKNNGWHYFPIGRASI